MIQYLHSRIKMWNVDQQPNCLDYLDGRPTRGAARLCAARQAARLAAHQVGDAEKTTSIKKLLKRIN